MSSRKVAYPATVERIDDIVGKDKIKYIKLIDNGFQIIHNIENSPLRIGDRVVYIEYDTLISPSTPFEFLRKRCWTEKYKAFKLKAMKMGDAISYGLIITVGDATKTILERNYSGANHPAFNVDARVATDGVDLSDALGIKPIDDAEEVENAGAKPPLTKWQRFLKRYLYFIWRKFYKQQSSMAFPSFAANKTDETRIENLQSIFETAKDMNVYSTVKMDGSSLTACIWKNNFYIASRNIGKYNQPLRKAIKQLVPENAEKLGKNDHFIRAACLYSLPKKMAAYKGIKHDFSVQAELCGPGIQKNKMGLAELTLYVFNLYDSIEKRFFNWDSLESFCIASEIPPVPFIERKKFDWKTTEELKEYAKGNYINGTPREGVVIRAESEKYSEQPLKGMSNMFSFKVINNDFVAKYDC